MHGLADVIVVGAGIIGAACGYRAAERGLRVTILEAADSPATGSTGRSAAGVRVQFGQEANVRLSWESIKEYQAFQDLYGTSAGYDPLGYLFLVPEASWPEHERALQMQRRLGAPVEALELSEAQKHVPFAEHGLHRASFGPQDGIVDPHGITHTYLSQARRLGAKLALGSEVLDASHHHGVWRLRTANAVHEAPIVVNAAGPWAGRVAGRAGLEVPVRPLRRMVFTTSPLEDPHRYPLTIDVTTGLYIRSEGPRILLGMSNPDEQPGFVEGIDWSWLPTTLGAALDRFRWLDTASLDRSASWWGYYEGTPDNNPILGRMPGAEGWLNACGFSGHGVQQAAAVGRAIAEEIGLGRSTSIDIDPFRMERFLQSYSALESHIV